MNSSDIHYDVFISSKSEDYPFAEEIYNFLVKNGYRCFLACRELDRIGESQYANAIDDALDQSDNMIVVASSVEHIKSEWVQAEWGTFVNDLRSNYRSGNLINILCGDIQLRDLPPRLRHQQTFSFSSFRDHILSYVRNSGKDSKRNAPKEMPPAKRFNPCAEVKPSVKHLDIDSKVDSDNTLEWIKGNSESFFKVSGTFLMSVEDVFKMEGRGVVATGKIERGEIHVGDKVHIVGNAGLRKSVVFGIEMFRKLFDSAKKDDVVGLLLREDLSLKRGDCIASPDTITDHDIFRAEIYMLTKEQGGGYDLNGFDSYDFWLWGTAVAGGAAVRKVISPGSRDLADITLSKKAALEVGMPFAIRGKGRTIGAGIVKAIIR